MRRPVTIKDMENMSDLYNKGYTINYIAGRLGFAHPTVKKYVAKPTTKKTTKVNPVFTSPTFTSNPFTKTETVVTAQELASALSLVKKYFKVEI